MRAWASRIAIQPPQRLQATRSVGPIDGYFARPCGTAGDKFPDGVGYIVTNWTLHANRLPCRKGIHPRLLFDVSVFIERLAIHARPRSCPSDRSHGQAIKAFACCCCGRACARKGGHYREPSRRGNETKTVSGTMRRNVPQLFGVLSKVSGTRRQCMDN